MVLTGWDEGNADLFSSWAGTRILEMERRHAPAVDFFISFFYQHFVQLGVERLNSTGEKEAPVGDGLSNERFHLLDIGCGSGLLFRKLLDKLSRDHPGLVSHLSFHFLDVSGSMLERARVACNKQFPAYLDMGIFHFHEGNFVSIASRKPSPIPTCSLITSLESIYYMEDMGKALSCCRKLLVDGGYLLLMVEDDMLASGDPVVDGKRIEFLAKEVNLEYLHFIELEDYRRLVLEAGFRSFDVKNIKGFTHMICQK